jgi:vancomycin permeability regulator SanA
MIDPVRVGKRRADRWRLTLFMLAFVAALSPVALLGYVLFSARSRSYPDLQSVPAEPVAIVFGAGVRGQGLSPMLMDRVRLAVDLYRAGRVRKLLMTGDNSRPDYDEVTPMRRFAVSRGVPEGDIVLDYAGFSTYESCYRARQVFGVKQAVLVTQSFHLARALYTCRQLGIEAVGVGAPDWGIYPDRVMTYYAVREAFATLKALWDVHIAQPLPTFLGPDEGWRFG